MLERLVGKAHETHARQAEPEGILHDEIDHEFVLVKVDLVLDFPQVPGIGHPFDDASLIKEEVRIKEGDQGTNQTGSPEKAARQNESLVLTFLDLMELAYSL